MRFIGNKESLSYKLTQFFSKKHLLRKELTFFDAFCGMGAVSAAVDGIYNTIILNDLLSSCVTYSRARLVAKKCQFQKLGFAPLTYLNESKETCKGFFYENYSPGGSERKYFTAENAARIDFFRNKIEEWKESALLSEEEYTYLIGCLLEAVSGVSNTAGVYGAFLKEWDKRALKDIVLSPIGTASLFGTEKVITYNERIEDIIASVDCDILYLDPPYTQNQYGTQYHLFETLVKNDHPALSRVTGSRPVTPLRSDWSKNHNCHILLDKVLAETRAKHIIISYNNDGFMSKDYIEATMKRYGKEGTFEMETIQYKKYNNHKCQGSDGHCEYVFYIEKKEAPAIYESPLNYTGSKSKMVNDIRQLLPADIDTFIDVFGGGFNVGANINAPHIIYNDINPFVVDLIKSFVESDTSDYLDYIEQQIALYGLTPNNREAYNAFRKKYNDLQVGQRDPKMLYTLILYGFQQQIRFNSAHEFNNPVGSRWFNDNLLSKFISFARALQKKRADLSFSNLDFQELIPAVPNNAFLYLDPPYRSTVGAYNDGRRGFQGWTINHEETLCKLLETASDTGVRFMLSYILENKGFYNQALFLWAKKNRYNIIEVGASQGRYNNRKEVLIINYPIN